MAKHLTYRDYVAAEAKGDKATMDAFDRQVAAEDAAYESAAEQDAENEQKALAALKAEFELHKEDHPNMTWEEFLEEAMEGAVDPNDCAVDSRGRP